MPFDIKSSVDITDSLKNTNADVLSNKLNKLKDSKGVDKEVNNAAKEFEALLLHQIMQDMWSSVQTEGILGGSREEQMYRDMLNDAVAKNVAEGEGIGLREVVAKDLSKMAAKAYQNK